ncbi:MAG: HEAT repeat domain-containing protein, partial [Bacteroidales bacterium]|nr:HEAT repeat domain-containing protein [Bacteroidales bacterium]
MTRTISILLLILLGTFSSMQAQDAHRTTATKVGDALNQLPAANEALFSRLMEDLLSTGEEGVLMLAQKLRSDGTSLPQAEYALDGMVQYVTRPGVDEEVRTQVAHHYAKALEKTEDPLIKAFFIRQLQLLGSGESLNVLAPYMFSQELGGTAIRAITAIGGPEAVDLLLSAPLRAETITGLGRLESPLAEKLLMSLAQTGNKEQLPLVWQALSRCGTMAAFDVMA